MMFKNRHSQKKVKVWGENHSKHNEVDRIRKEVISFKPDFIIHELDWEDKKFYEDKIPGVKVLPLEPSNKNRKLPRNIQKAFEIREKEMVKILSDLPSGRIAVVVGDTHLRTIPTKELGSKSPLLDILKKYKSEIIRSNHKEIK